MPSDTLPLALEETQGGTTRIALGPRAVVLRGFVASWAAELVAAIDGLAAVSPFGHMVTPGGWEMLVALSDCPRWVDRRWSGLGRSMRKPDTGRRQTLPKADIWLWNARWR